MSPYTRWEGVDGSLPTFDVGKRGGRRSKDKGTPTVPDDTSDEPLGRSGLNHIY